MSDFATNADRLIYLAESVCEEIASDNDFVELDDILLTDCESRHRFLDYCQMHVALKLELRAHRATQMVRQQVDSTSAGLPSEVAIDETALPSSALMWHNTLGYFSSGWPAAYLIATVVLGIGLVIGAVTHVSQPVRIVNRSPSAMGDAVMFAPRNKPIGRITGMVDCQWTDESTAATSGAYVPLGRKFALASGLMEITYDTGAKIILQGPVTYEVESTNGGFLSVGKLTGRVDAQAAKGFSVHTPTAIVTDLGTEFGVEVDSQGRTAAHVFRGKVDVQFNGDRGTEYRIQLGASESVVQSRQDHAPVIRRDAVLASTYVRQLPRLKRAPIDVFNSGIGLKEGDPDPHWQIVAVSNDPSFQPRAATVTSGHPRWLMNDPEKSQWISVSANWQAKNMADDLTYTYRTTFELRDYRTNTARMHGCFIADDTVQAIRLNGRTIHTFRDYISYDVFRWFTIDRGFVAGKNVLEIDVHDIGVSTGLRVELDGDVQKYFSN